MNVPLPFLIPLAVLLLNECTKAFIEGMRSGNWHHAPFRPGGMPSTHAAFAVSILLLVGHRSTFDSSVFLVACALACVVCYDAITLRQSVGRQAEVLNHIQKWRHLTTRIGHSLYEVTAGVVFGATITEIALLLVTGMW